MTAEPQVETHAIWLVILREGGYWSSSELSKELGVPSDLISRVINAMARRGFVRRHEGAPLNYSVDKSCRIPRAVKLADLMDAGIEV